MILLFNYMPFSCFSAVGHVFFFPIIQLLLARFSFGRRRYYKLYGQRVHIFMIAPKNINHRGTIYSFFTMSIIE